MERKDISEKVRSILIHVLQHEDFEMRDDLKASDVAGWDSLSHMIIVADIEKEFGIRFKLKELRQLEDMHSLIGLIQSKV